MTTLLARILLSLALLVHGVGVIAAEIGMASQPHCHAAGAHGKQGKMPCCHCDECTLPACASGCAVDCGTFIVPVDIQPVWHAPVVASAHSRVAEHRSVDASPPLRPPIA